MKFLPSQNKLSDEWKVSSLHTRLLGKEQGCQIFLGTKYQNGGSGKEQGCQIFHGTTDQIPLHKYTTITADYTKWQEKNLMP
jgi:hypothetical protein